MKKRVLSGVAAAGLLLLGAAAWPQARQAEPPSYRDVLRGKVGQECSANTTDRVHWTLWYGPRHSGDKLAAVGQDFVQIRYADGREQYLPFQRIHVVDTNNVK